MLLFFFFFSPTVDIKRARFPPPLPPPSFLALVALPKDEARNAVSREKCARKKSDEYIMFLL